MIIVESPLIIGSHLLPCYRMPGVGAISVIVSDLDEDGRLVWRVIIDDASGQTIYDATDLTTPYSPTPTFVGVIESVLSFLGACAESYMSHGENYDLFPEWVAEWAYQYEGELAMARLDLEEVTGE